MSVEREALANKQTLLQMCLLDPLPAAPPAQCHAAVDAGIVNAVTESH